MIIVDRKAFLAMPPETLFSKYKPIVFEELLIKGDSIFWEGGGDFFYQQLADSIDCDDCGGMIDALEKSRLIGHSVKLDFECQTRDGCFDDDQLFAVFEQADIEALIARLGRCLTHHQSTKEK